MSSNLQPKHAAKKYLTRLLFIVKVVSSSPILITLMMEAVNSSETSVLIRATQRIIPKDVTFQYYFVVITVYSLDIKAVSYKWAVWISYTAQGRWDFKLLSWPPL
jgi:hypothetical protein